MGYICIYIICKLFCIFEEPLPSLLSFFIQKLFCEWSYFTALAQLLCYYRKLCVFFFYSQLWQIGGFEWFVRYSSKESNDVDTNYIFFSFFPLFLPLCNMRLRQGNKFYSAPLFNNLHHCIIQHKSSINCHYMSNYLGIYITFPTKIEPKLKLVHVQAWQNLKELKLQC